MTPDVGSSDPHLMRIISPACAALLIVDVQNDFCHQSGLFGKLGMDLRAIQAAVKRIEELLPVARRNGVPVIFVMMEHDAATNSSAWLNRYPTPRADACVAGTWGAAFYAISPAEGEQVVTKNRYSPFVGTNIEYLLRAQKRTSLIVAGVATNICVEAVLRDGFCRDYDVVLVEDCAGAYSERAHVSTVENTRSFLGRVVNSEMLKRHWLSSPDQQQIKAQTIATADRTR